MTDIQIDKSIDIPKRIATGRKKKYPFREMDVGDSFLFPNPKNLPVAQLRNLANSTSQYYSRLTNTKFTIRATEEGVRIWRIE